MCNLQCVGHISGAHINPAVTIATLINGQKSIPAAVIYIVSQLVGSILGYGVLMVRKIIKLFMIKI